MWQVHTFQRSRKNTKRRESTSIRCQGEASVYAETQTTRTTVHTKTHTRAHVHGVCTQPVIVVGCGSFDFGLLGAKRVFKQLCSFFSQNASVFS